MKERRKGRGLESWDALICLGSAWASKGGSELLGSELLGKVGWELLGTGHPPLCLQT